MTDIAPSAPDNGADPDEPRQRSERRTSGGLGLWLRERLGRRANASIREDLEDALSGNVAGGPDFSPEERAMLKNILDLRSLRVIDVMVPRADIVAVPHTIALGDLIEAFEQAEHSRLPVYRETLDDPIGIVHVKDMVHHLTSRARLSEEPAAGRFDFTRIDTDLPLEKAAILRPVLFAPPSMPAIDLLAKMQAERIHLALVVDEYGGTDGLVTIEDLVEMVVGDIEDEHDEDEHPMIQRVAEGHFIADARAPLEDVEARLGGPFALEEETDDIDTIGGLLVTLARRVPVRGELVPGPDGLEFEVLEADPRRVKRIRIVRRTTPGMALSGEPVRPGLTASVDVPGATAAE